MIQRYSNFLRTDYLFSTKLIHCKIKNFFIIANNSGSGSIESCGLSYSTPEIIGKHDLRDGETVLCLGDGSDCKPIHCFAMKMNADETIAP